MILRKVVEQLIDLQQKFPLIGETEVRDSENPEYTVASFEFDEAEQRVYIQFKECE